MDSIGRRQNHRHNDIGNIQLHAHGVKLYPDISIGWDYQSRTDPETGERVNPTPYSKSRFAHNTVIIDRSEPPKHPRAKFSELKRSGPMQLISLVDNSYDNTSIVRTIGVTPEYVLDRVRVVKDEKKNDEKEHTIDYLLHGPGLIDLHGIEGMTPYKTLGEEYGFGVIDTRSDAPENQWIRPGPSGSADGRWEAVVMPTQACLRR